MIAHQEETWALDKELHAKLRKGGVKLDIGPEGEGQHILTYEKNGGASSHDQLIMLLMRSLF